MSWLLDTNVLLRLADEQSQEHSVAAEAVERLLARGISVFISAQVLVEFWVVATRPEQVNGLGWSTATTAETIRALRDRFPMVEETPDVWDRWFELFNTADFPASWGVEAVHPERLLATDGHG